MSSLPRAYLSQKLVQPLPTKEGVTLRTVGEAANYVLALPPERAEHRNRWRHAARLLTAAVAGFSDGRRLGTIEPVLKPSVSFVLFMIFSSDLSFHCSGTHIDLCRCSHIGSPLSVALLAGSQATPKSDIL